MLSRKLYLPALKAGLPQPPRLVSVDLQPMAPIEGVIQLQVNVQPLKLVFNNLHRASHLLGSKWVRPSSCR